jgi:hypothetical protein
MDITNLKEFSEIYSDFKPDFSRHILALVSTHPVIEISTMNFPGGKGWLMCKAGKLSPSVS